MKLENSYRKSLRNAFAERIETEAASLPKGRLLKMDLHCHDRNSDKPDELWGRILRLPETWMETEDLMACQRSNGVDVLTVTNHNNARSCWEQLDRGVELLPAAEFTCRFPAEELHVHVLTYGFTPEQEVRLNTIRHDIYRFLAYCAEHGLPTVLAHPLYFYTQGRRPEPFILEKFALLFERFEALNGQREVRQNLLTAEWIRSIDEERLRTWSKRHGIRPENFCTHPWRKSMTGGTDDHFGIFAGGNGTLFSIPEDDPQWFSLSRPEQVLRALREGRCAPYGSVGEEEKLHTGLLNYLSQVALNMEDPGMLRVLLHKGSASDKLTCIAIANMMFELRRHKYTYRFFGAAVDAFQGKPTSLLTKLMTSRDYRPVIAELEKIAEVRRNRPSELPDLLQVVYPELFRKLCAIALRRLDSTLAALPASEGAAQTLSSLISRMEIPLELRAWGGRSGGQESSKKNMVDLDIASLFDQLSFPLLAATMVGGASYLSTRLQHEDRTLYDSVSRKLGVWGSPRRMLWLTDTFGDGNGVSTVLRQVLDEIRRLDLPIDILVCSDKLQDEPHLKVVAPIHQFPVPGYPEQTIRVPSLLDVQKVFAEEGYDRVMCSTELLMGPVALYLKSAFHVPAFLFMHTDWVDFVRRNLRLDHQGHGRIRRTLRAFYQQFDTVLVLNQEHRTWLTGRRMNLQPERVKLTAHWADPVFRPLVPLPEKFAPTAPVGAPLLLYVGRLSIEKGVRDLPLVWEAVRRHHPDAQLLIAGKGPAEAELRQAMPAAIFPGWLSREELAQLYASVDLLLLPSRFDTFGCVVLEALGCGTPVAAYRSKGPADILSQGVDGFLSEGPEEMASQIVEYLDRRDQREMMAGAALSKAALYRPEKILSQLLADCGMEQPDWSALAPADTQLHEVEMAP